VLTGSIAALTALIEDLDLNNNFNYLNKPEIYWRWCAESVQAIRSYNNVLNQNIISELAPVIILFRNS